MAGTSYTRQSTLTDGDTITASLFNAEYNQLVSAFSYAASGTTGHQHDGSAGEGGNIHTIGDQDFNNKIVVDSTNNRWSVYVEVGGTAVEQVRIEDGVVYPVTDSDVDLGTDTLRFKNAYIDSLTATGNLTVGGNIIVTGNVDVDGIVEFDGLSGTGAVTVTNILDEDNMSSNSATALATQQSIKAYVDAQVTAQDLDLTDGTTSISIDLDSEALSVLGGTGIDSTASGNGVTLAIDSTVATLTGSQTLTNKTLTSPDVNTPDIDGGTIDGTVIGGTTAAAGSFTTVGATGNITVGGTVDGRDVAADGTKLDTVETNADVTDTANVTAAGALMDSEVTNLAQVKAFDSSDYATAAQGTTADAALPKAGGAMTGAITTNSTFDGRDVATDGTKLDGIEALADVTDATNVTAAGALMDSELTSIASVKALDQGVATTDSPTFVDVTATSLDISGDIDVDGTTNLDATNIVGALDVTGTATMDAAKVETSTTSTVTISENTGSGTAELRFVATDSFPKTKIVTDVSDASLSLETLGNDRLKIANNGDISFYEDTGTTPKLFWDASAESLGIGTSSPSSGYILDARGWGNFQHPTGDSLVKIQTGNNTGTSLLYFSDSDSVFSGSIAYLHTDDAMRFNTNATERMRIDASGNLLVGHTSAEGDSSGTTLYQNGQTVHKADGAYALELVRSTSDGDIAVFRKDSTTVGSIGSHVNGLLIGTTEGSDAFLKFESNAVRPSAWNGSYRDAAIDLGHTSSRFKDLHLSGSVNTEAVSTNSLDLQAIAESKSVTAVDVFVYDTSKDSDGGAWRNRTQGTSWYNETLNTSTRGATRKFPSVAVIVAESNKVTIYDGDDPAMPMWMVFNANTYNSVRMISIGSGGTVRCVSTLNGVVSVGKAGASSSVASDGINLVNFIEDGARQYNASSSYTHKSNISDRNTVGYGGAQGNPIINHNVNDIAMTVLPNAPIDADTGLPVPTIAVATDGGVSVIKDDGTVFDWVATDYTKAYHIAFRSSDNFIVFTNGDASSKQAWIRAMPIPTADISQVTGYSDSYGFEMYCVLNNAYTGQDMALPEGDTYTASPDALAVSDRIYLGGDKGLTIVDTNLQNYSQGLISHIKSNFNTGWMNGDIKLATLSDTDDTNVTGSELSNVSSFTDLSGAGNSVSESGGSVTGTHTTSGNCHYKGALFSTVAGNIYSAVLNHVGGSTCSFRVSDGTNDNTIIQKNSLTTAGIVSITFTATSSSSYISFINNAGFQFNSLSIRSGELDRSVNRNGLQVYGTVTKTAVATGADLVAYSGFSGSNVLEQPYNADLNFGTGDFSIMGWVKMNSVMAAGIVARGSLGSTDQFIYLGTLANGKLQMYIHGSQVNSSKSYSTGSWFHVTMVRRSGVAYLYLNGVQDATTLTSTVNLDSTVHTTRIGKTTWSNSGGLNGSVALIRISATAPSAEQIAKMYNDEKYLFQDGAQATLYGTSDSVTALAYDDDTELLHAGTSSGRSVFQGLRRVSNTTDAVGVAISASNDLVVEE